MIHDEIFKRILSSIILFPLIILAIANGGFFFNFVIILCLIISLIEWSKISFNKIIFYLGFFFLLFSFYSIFKIRNFYFSNDQNIFMFIYVFIICVSTDIGGFFFGKLFKGPKLTKISPNKTYSGFIGAIFLSAISSYLFLKNSNLFFLTLYHNDLFFLSITLLMSIISQLGDIIISYFKRKSKLKDTGNLIPGHGGLLDRIDGIIFVYPSFYLLLFFINFI